MPFLAIFIANLYNYTTKNKMPLKAILEPLRALSKNEQKKMPGSMCRAFFVWLQGGKGHL